MTDLEALARLWKSGALTEEEFNAAKARLLGTSTSPTQKQQPAAGWYPDPQHADLVRYWTGSAWSSETAPSGQLHYVPSDDSAKNTSDTRDLHVGGRIFHPAFGEGTVVEISGLGDRQEATITFDLVGRRHLAIAFAPIKRISG